MSDVQPIGYEALSDEALALVVEKVEHAWGEGFEDIELLTVEAKRLIARLRVAEANQRTLIAALRGSLQAQDRDPGDPTFDAAVAQLLEPGQPIPEPRT